MRLADPMSTPSKIVPQSAPDDEPLGSESVRSGVARAMVRIYKEQFGRGPTAVKAGWVGSDTLVCVLEDTLTPAERKLVALGEHNAVREMRSALQLATIADFCAPVERLTGRKVRSFHSTMDTVADGMAVEVFVLHPEAYDGPDRAEAGLAAGEVR